MNDDDLKSIALCIIAPLVVITVLCGVLVSILSLNGCSPKEEYMHELERQGYEDVEITGSKVWKCEPEDKDKIGFRAKSPRGDSVNGVVCCRPGYRCRVRIDGSVGYP